MGNPINKRISKQAAKAESILRGCGVGIFTVLLSPFTATWWLMKRTTDRLSLSIETRLDDRVAGLREAIRQQELRFSWEREELEARVEVAEKGQEMAVLMLERYRTQVQADIEAAIARGEREKGHVGVGE